MIYDTRRGISSSCDAACRMTGMIPGGVDLTAQVFGKSMTTKNNNVSAAPLYAHAVGWAGKHLCGTLCGHHGHVADAMQEWSGIFRVPDCHLPLQVSKRAIQIRSPHSLAYIIIRTQDTSSAACLIERKRSKVMTQAMSESKGEVMHRQISVVLALPLPRGYRICTTKYLSSTMGFVISSYLPTRDREGNLFSTNGFD